MTEPVRVLYIDDDPGLARLVTRTLAAHLPHELIDVVGDLWTPLEQPASHGGEGSQGGRVGDDDGQGLADLRVREHGVEDPYGKVIALTAAPDKAMEWGIDETRILPFSESVGGRYSLWSSIGFPAARAC